MPSGISNSSQSESRSGFQSLYGKRCVCCQKRITNMTGLHMKTPFEQCIARTRAMVRALPIRALFISSEILHGCHMARPNLRSEEHTSELQSLMPTSYDVFCLKKKINKHTPKSLTKSA